MSEPVEDLSTRDFYAALGTSLLSRQLRPVLVAAFVMIVVGAFFYSLVEGWSLLDAAYFAVITLATIGYGDLVPVTPLGRAFTIGYVLLGVGVVGAFVSGLIRLSVENANDRERARSRREAATGPEQNGPDGA